MTDTTYLLNLARQSISYYLETGKKLVVEERVVPKEYMEKQGVFVTLTTSKDSLRGCIGYLEGIEPIYKAVINNAVSAAVNDPRFTPVSVEELASLKIEISILTILRKLEYQDGADLVRKLTEGKSGVIIKQGFYQATFLPQVWEELRDPEQFLGHLCQKAGLDYKAWEKGKLEVLVYDVEKLTE